MVSGTNKLDALTRILEAEPFDAMIVFARTKLGTEELAERLRARGFAAAAINGDLDQKQREKTIQQLKDGRVDILVATDVAARGLDVERISHVLNYDIPYDTESYVHRIGRTGRAGRSGEAILFIAPREERMLRSIERATRQPIEPMQMPTASDVNQQRVARFKQRISDTLAADDLELYERLVTEFEQEHGVEPLRIAAALARLAQGDVPLLLPEREPRPERVERPARQRPERRGPQEAARPLRDFPEVPMQRFRLEVGHRHGVKPGNIVGAIANEAELDARYIGHIDIFDDFSLVDLPAGMPKEVLRVLQKARVCGRMIELRTVGEDGGRRRPGREPRMGAGRAAGARKPSQWRQLRQAQR